MGCPCRKNKNEQSKQQNTESKSDKVSKKDHSLRLAECANCQFSTKFDRGGKKVLAVRSICTESNRLLVNALRDPRYSCPVGRFEKLR